MICRPNAEPTSLQGPPLSRPDASASASVGMSPNASAGSSRARSRTGDTDPASGRRRHHDDQSGASDPGKVWLADRADALVDEIPSAYKDIDQVMADQTDLGLPATID